MSRVPVSKTLPTSQPTIWPNFFLVGAARAATTSLWEWLRGHPEIYMSPLKETHFFASGKPQVVPVIRSEREYLRLFRGVRDEKVIGEASPSYLRDPEAPGRIKEVSPDARILIVLRDPVARAYSTYWHELRYGRLRDSFADRARAIATKPRPGDVGRGFYAPGLRRYLELFEPRVLVLIFEELVADVRGHVRRVLEFLDVDPDYADHFDTTRRNPSALPRNAAMTWVYRSHRMRGVVSRVLPAVFHGHVERAMLGGPTAPPMDDATRRFLTEFYRPDVADVERMLGRRLPWPTSRERNRATR